MTPTVGARRRVIEQRGERVGGEVEHDVAEARGADDAEAFRERRALVAGERATEPPLEEVGEREQARREAL